MIYLFPRKRYLSALITYKSIHYTKQTQKTNKEYRHSGCKKSFKLLYIKQLSLKNRFILAEINVKYFSDFTPL